MDHIILTAIGTDRPGLVDEVSQFIFERGGNIEDSRMVNLRGQFAMMVLVGGAKAAFDRLQTEAGQLQRQTGLHVELHPAAGQRAEASAQAMAWRLSAATIDQPGLVHRISHLLRSQNANIESLETRLVPAPITGAPMFELELVMSIPRSTPISQLREQLGRLCDDLNIDWHLAAV